jgi:hypothetical protein
VGSSGCLGRAPCCVNYRGKGREKQLINGMPHSPHLRRLQLLVHVHGFKLHCTGQRDGHRRGGGRQCGQLLLAALLDQGWLSILGGVG